MASNEFMIISDYEKAAMKNLSQKTFAYYRCGVGDEEMVQENCTAYKRWRFQPLLLRDISKVDLCTKVFGSSVPFPICIAPTAYHKDACITGEVATAKAAESLGAGFVLSGFGNCSMEEIAEEAPNCLRWCNIQIVKNRGFIKHFVARAERNGFRAIVVTIDHPIVCKRTNKTPDGRNNDYYSSYATKNLYESTKLWESDIDGGLAFIKMYDGTITWDDLVWLKNLTKLKVIVKGVLTGKMAMEAVSHGMDGIIVSNHGGRELDEVFSTIEALPEVVEAVNGKCDVYIDGGIRKGSDVAKAIALGAKAVFVGRPILWGLACEQENGVRRVLEILRDELKMTMQMIGVRSLEELQSTPGLVVRESAKLSKL